MTNIFKEIDENQSPQRQNFINEFSISRISSIYQPFIDNGLSEIRKFNEAEGDDQSDNNTIAKIRDQIWEEEKLLDQQCDAFKMKKPKSEVISNDYERFVEKNVGFSDFPNQRRDKYQKGDRFDAVNTPERKSKSKSLVQKFGSEKPSIKKKNYWDQLPEEQLVRFKNILKSYVNSIKNIVSQSKNNSLMKQIQQNTKEIEKKLSGQKILLKKFIKSVNLSQVVDKLSSSILESQEQKRRMYFQTLVQIEENVCRLISFEKGESFEQFTSEEVDEKQRFIKKDKIHESKPTSQTWQGPNRSTRSRSRSSRSRSISKSKQKQNPLIQKIKSVFSMFQSDQSNKNIKPTIFEPKSSILKEAKSKQIPYSSKLSSLLSIEPINVDPNSLVKCDALKKFIEQKSSKLAKQKVADYLQSKKILYHMVNDMYQEKNWWIENDQSTQERSQLNHRKQEEREVQQTLNQKRKSSRLLKNFKPQYFNASYLKYKPNEMDQIQNHSHQIIHENCQVLHFINNKDPKNLNSMSSRRNQQILVNFGKSMAQSFKKSEKFANSSSQDEEPSKDRKKENAEKQRSPDRVQRDFSPVAATKMTGSAMVPNLNYTHIKNDSSDSNQQRDTFDEQIQFTTYKSSHKYHKQSIKPSFHQPQHKNPSPAYYSINLMNTSSKQLAEKQQNLIYLGKNRPSKRKQLQKQAYDMFLDGYNGESIGIWEFFQNKIPQKVENFVEERLNTHKNSKSKTKGRNIGIKQNNYAIKERSPYKQTKEGNQLFVIPSQGNIDINGLENDSDSKHGSQRLQEILEIWSNNPLTRREAINNDDQDDDKIRRFLKIGQFKETNQRPVQFHKNEKKNNQIQKCLDSSSLQQYAKQCDQHTKNFQVTVEKKFTYQKINPQELIDLQKQSFIENIPDKNQSTQILKDGSSNQGKKIEVKNQSKISKKQTVVDANKKITTSVILKKVVSEDESDSNEKEEKLPSFSLPNDDSKVNTQQKSQQKASLKIEKKVQQKSEKEKPQNQPKSQVSPSATDKKISPKSIFAKPPITQSQLSQQQKQPQKKLNIFSQGNKQQHGKNLFNQSIPSQPGFGKASNIFNRPNEQPKQQLQQQQGNQNVLTQQANLTQPQGFTSFNPKQFQQAFQPQQNQKTFAGFQPIGQTASNNPIIQHLNPQMASSGPVGFDSFNPSAFNNMRETGGQFRSGNRLIPDDPRLPPLPGFLVQISQATNPFDIIRQNFNSFGFGQNPNPYQQLDQNSIPPNIPQNYMQARK